MIRWIQNRPWQSSIILSLFALFLFGGIDAISIGLISLAVSISYALSVLLARHFAWLSLLLIATGSALSAILGIRSGATGAISLVALVLLAAFAEPMPRLVALPVTAVSGISLLWFTVYENVRGLGAYEIVSSSELGQLNIFLFGALLVISTTTLSWVAGRLLITRATHVGTTFDRAIAERMQAQQALEIAEQNERFQIARDISELIIQRVSASISLAEGGVYATQTDPATAPRILEKVAESARAGHKELRRLFDMLNKTHEITSAPPRINDLENLVIAFRQIGYNINLRHEGARFAVDEGAELAIYRIVFDALENIRKHAPIGTDITIDFAWTETGLQVLIKDNGVELRNRGLSLEELSYTIEEDRKALVETIVGAGLTAMSERAALYGGTIEATRIPGVGFTVSAIFPICSIPLGLSVLRIALIDGDVAIRAGRRLMIDSQANLQLVYEESEALVALEKIPELLVDVIVIDHRLQGLNGIELSQRLVDAFSEKGELCPTIIVTGSYATPELVLAAIRSGASDVVTQDAPIAELLTAINNAAQARSLANFADFQEILESADYRPKPDPLFVLRRSQLQEMEKDLLQLVEDGSTFVEAKDELALAEIDFQKLIEQVQIKLHMATTEQLLLALHDAR